MHQRPLHRACSWQLGAAAPSTRLSVSVVVNRAAGVRRKSSHCCTAPSSWAAACGCLPAARPARVQSNARSLPSRGRAPSALGVHAARASCTQSPAGLWLISLTCCSSPPAAGRCTCKAGAEAPRGSCSRAAKQPAQRWSWAGGGGLLPPSHMHGWRAGCRGTWTRAASRGLCSCAAGPSGAAAAAGWLFPVLTRCLFAGRSLRVAGRLGRSLRRGAWPCRLALRRNRCLAMHTTASSGAPLRRAELAQHGIMRHALAVLTSPIASCTPGCSETPRLRGTELLTWAQPGQQAC